MDKQIGINIKLVRKPETKKYPEKKFYEKRRQPYLLPCSNNKEFCFLQIKKNNALYCKTWKKIIWYKCRHHLETGKYKWEER